MKISNDLNADKIKYYTSIVIAGSLAIAPLVFWIQLNYSTKETLFFTAIFLSILFVGRLCLEIGLFLESTIIDSIIKCRIKENKKYYKGFRECENPFNENWYKYLMLNKNKAAKEVISHMVDRMLFFLSSTIGLLVGLLLFFILFKTCIQITLVIIFFSIIYFYFSIIRIITLAAGLDFLRYIIIKGDPCDKSE